jgi:TonB family protein
MRMLGWSTLGARFGILGASAAVHAGVGLAFALVGHGVPARGVAPVELPIEMIDAPRASPVADDEPVQAREEGTRHTPAAHAHRHPYPVLAHHDATPHDPSIVHAPLGAAPPSAPAAAPDTLAAPPAPARFAMNLGSAAIATGGASSPRGSAGAPPRALEILSDASVASRARLVYGPPPPYPSDARAAEIEADVPLEIVVDARGTVVDARVTRPAGYGLDEAALRAARARNGRRARRGDHAVAVRMRWSMEFRLR